jgi:hypothetical protein
MDIAAGWRDVKLAANAIATSGNTVVPGGKYPDSHIDTRSQAMNTG